jgi:hypothetical protein
MWSDRAQVLISGPDPADPDRRILKSELRYNWHGSGSYENVTVPKHRPELVCGMPYNRTRA